MALPQYSVLTVLAVLTVVGLCSLAVMLVFSWAVRPLTRERKASNVWASQTYECGYPAVGNARAIGFQYLHYAALFLVFDIAALYLFLYARLPKPASAASAGMILGILTLLLMILYTAKRRRVHVA